MKPAYTEAAVRAVEEHLISQQRHTDELMQLAAQAVAHAASTIIINTSFDAPSDAPSNAPSNTPSNTGRSVMVLAGPGGNGGDGLYAGAFLARAGHAVYAHLTGNPQREALQAFRAAGGTLCEELPADTALLIDAIAGLGSARDVEGPAWELYRQATGIPVLAVDMPTGVDARTGQAAAQAIVADFTITFGEPREGHLYAPECGEIIVADLALNGAPSFAALLHEHSPAGFLAQAGKPSHRWTPAAGVGDIASFVDPTPTWDSHKYSGGVVGLAAGSKRYPGAGILATLAAVKTTPSLVRVIGDPAIIAAVPEVIVHPDVRAAGPVQAWVVGPGRGTDEQAAQELRDILAQHLPTVVDADAITVLAQNTEIALHEQVILTPHWGEFTRLYKARIGEPTGSRARMLQQLSQELGCHILLKGRVTTVAGEETLSLNAGNSFAATPGSGDVLSGILGATVAMGGQSLDRAALQAAAVHAHAAEIAARTAEGYAPCSASMIAAAIPQATARLIASHRDS